METTVEIRTHQFEVVFNDGARIRSYSEDSINHEADDEICPLVDGFQTHLDRLSRPGMIQAKDGLFRPHSTIRAVRHLSSDVTSVLTLEFDEEVDLWAIVSED